MTTELLGYSGVAELADVAPDTVKTWVLRRDLGFPPPDHVEPGYNGRHTWRRETVCEWLKQTGRMTPAGAPIRRQGP